MPAATGAPVHPGRRRNAEIHRVLLAGRSNGRTRFEPIFGRQPQHSPAV